MTRMTRTRPVAGASSGQARLGPGDSDASESAGEIPDKEITSPTKTHNKTCSVDRPATRDHPRAVSMPRRPRPGPGRPGPGSTRRQGPHSMARYIERKHS